MQHGFRLVGPPQAAPELACLRIIAQLPASWAGVVHESGIGYAVLVLHADSPYEEVAAAVRAALASAPLRRWSLTSPSRPAVLAVAPNPARPPAGSVSSVTRVR
ncbi:hypothetical protein [Streptomyces sp. NPDC004788]